MSTVIKTPAYTGDNQDASMNSRPMREWRIVLYAVIAGLIMFTIGVGMDMMVVREGETRLLAFGISDGLAAAVAGFLVYRLLQYEQERRARLRDKLAVVSDMNHHVRNALQVISFHAYSNADREQLEAVKESMERIEWALKEILPKL
jgi:signal transduction histidine kinase